MFGIGMPELIIIMVIALIVIGPQKLPELAKSLGKGLAEFKRATDDFKQGIEAETRLQDEKERLAKVVEEPVAAQHQEAAAADPYKTAAAEPHQATVAEPHQAEAAEPHKVEAAEKKA